MTDKANISTENQPKGAARNPSDTLDKPSTDPKADQTTDQTETEEDPGFATNGE